MSDPGWAFQIDPPVLLPGRPVRVSITYTPEFHVILAQAWADIHYVQDVAVATTTEI